MDDHDFNDPAWLKDQLKQPGRSQLALAKRLGVDQAAVNRLVNGKRQLKAREIPVVKGYLAETEAANSADRTGLLTRQLGSYVRSGAINDPPSFDKIFNSVNSGDDAEFLKEIVEHALGCCFVYIANKYRSMEQNGETTFPYLIATDDYTLGIAIEIVASFKEVPLEVLDDFRRVARVVELFNRRKDVRSLDSPEVQTVWAGSWAIGDRAAGFASIGDALRSAIVFIVTMQSHYLTTEIEAAEKYMKALNRWAARASAKQAE